MILFNRFFVAFEVEIIFLYINLIGVYVLLKGLLNADLLSFIHSGLYGILHRVWTDGILQRRRDTFVAGEQTPDTLYLSGNFELTMPTYEVFLAGQRDGLELMGVSHIVTATKSSADGAGEEETIRNDEVLVVLNSNNISLESVAQRKRQLITC
jgi:hypothetical protein